MKTLGVSRRDFLARMVGAVVGAMGAMIGIPAAAYVIGPSDQSTSDDWGALGPTDSFSADEPTLITTTVAKQQGLILEEHQLSVYVSNLGGGHFVVLSDRCTHLGCRVNYVAETDRGNAAGFYCPCHGGIFDADGGIVAGPVPRPLDRLETRVDDGALFVREL